MSSSRKLAYGLVTALLVLGLAEGILRLTGFRYHRITRSLQFNYPRPGYLEAFFEIDPALLYRIRPTVKQRWVDLTYQPRFDLKIRDHRTFGRRPPGTVRIIALGDSSTYGVNTRLAWPTRLQSLLERVAPGRFEVVNLGVPGYTAFQGRRVLETRGERLQPSWAVLYFGWNDHLLALGYADAEQKVGRGGVVAARNILSGSRIYQAVSWAVARARPVPESDGKRRVGPGAFMADLSASVDMARELGAAVLLCTYPTALPHLAGTAAPVPDWLFETHLGEGTVDDLLGLQESYNDAVRRLAAETGSRLVDLDAAFRNQGPAHLFQNPAGDMIHPNDAGYDLVARLVYRALAEEGVVPSGSTPAAR